MPRLGPQKDCRSAHVAPFLGQCHDGLVALITCSHSPVAEPDPVSGGTSGTSVEV